MTTTMRHLVLHYGGELTIDENLYPTYTGGNAKVIQCPIEYKLDQLKYRIHRAIKLTPESYNINLICKYPFRDTFIAWRIEDDDDCNSLLVEAQDVSLYLYVQTELLIRTQESIENTPNITEVTSGMCTMHMTDSLSIQPVYTTSQNCEAQLQSPQYDIPSTSRGPNVEMNFSPSNTGYESMCSEDNTISSESVEEGLNTEDPEIIAAHHSNVDSILRDYIFKGNQWVSQLTVTNEYAQFARSANEWDAELDFDGHTISPSEQIDFRVPTDLYEGMIFSNKWDLQCTIASWSIIHNVEYRKYDSNKKKLTLICVDHDHPSRPCPWRLHAVNSKRLNGAWKLSRLRGPHRCSHLIDDGGHKQCTSKFISRFILPSIRTQLDIKPREIIGRMADRFNVRISYLKAWDARRKAIKAIFGGWEESYKSLYRYMEAISLSMSGTVYNIQHNQEGRFERIFWSFGPCISGWVHCRPVISLDGTFLLGKYRGTLLTAVGVDANNGIFPLAFAVVEAESNASWEWFLITMRDYIGDVLERPNLCIISDKHSGLLKGVRVVFPDAAHRHCLRHLRENFKKALRGMGLKATDSLCDKMYGAGNTDDIDKFNQHMLDLAAVSPEVIKWLHDRDLEKWTLLHDGGYRYSSMTTNASECYNGVLKRARGLPIQALISATYYHIIGLFLKRQTDGTTMAREGISLFVPRAYSMLHSFELQARSIYSRVRINMNEYEVHDSENHIYRIDTSNASTCVCTCTRPMIYHMPCSHSIAALGSSRIDHTQFVSPYFTVKNYIATYAGQFHSVPDSRSWPPFNYMNGIIELAPPIRVRKRGRPQVRRIKNSMDEQRRK